MGQRPPSSGPRGGVFRRRATIAGSLIVVLVVAVGSALYFRTSRSARSGAGVDLGRLSSGVARDHLNLVIVTLDTTRADHMGAYGNKVVETPTFDRLAREGCAVLCLDSLVRRAFAVPAARTICDALQGAPLQRRDRVRRQPGRTRGRETRVAESVRADGGDGDGRPRREPWRSRRGVAWFLHLQQHDARAVRDPDA